VVIAIAIAAVVFFGARAVSNDYVFFAGYTVLQYIVLATAWNILGGYTGYVNFGSAVSNSFVLAQPATITNVTLTLYDVDDRNQPERLTWKITTEPLGGTVLASGLAPLISLQPPYITQFLFFAWDLSFDKSFDSNANERFGSTCKARVPDQSFTIFPRAVISISATVTPLS